VVTVDAEELMTRIRRRLDIYEANKTPDPLIAAAAAHACLRSIERLVYPQRWLLPDGTIVDAPPA